MGKVSKKATSNGDDKPKKSAYYTSLQEALKESLKNLTKKNELTRDELLKKFNEFSKQKYGIDTTKQTLKNYFSAKAIPRPDMLCAIADFFGVSVDYLLGRSKYTEVTNELIGHELGLKDNAINGLRLVYDFLLPEERELYNFFLSSVNFILLCKNFYKYVHCNYKVPFYFDGEAQTIPHSQYEKDKWRINLASSAENPSADFVTVHIDDTFFLNVARERIRDNLNNIKKEYLEEIRNQNEGKTKEHKKAKKKSARKK